MVKLCKDNHVAPHATGKTWIIVFPMKARRGAEFRRWIVVCHGVTKFYSQAKVTKIELICV